MKVLNSQTIDTETHEKLLTLIKSMLKSELNLSEFEQGFLSDFADKLEKWGEKTFMSEKQKAVVDKMFDKHIGE